VPPSNSWNNRRMKGQRSVNRPKPNRNYKQRIRKVGKEAKAKQKLKNDSTIQSSSHLIDIKLYIISHRLIQPINYLFSI
jgi:hypothetical protein